MKKNVLVLAPRNVAEVLRIEKALLSLGFDTLRVTSMQDALYRIKSEIFSSIICLDAVDGSVQRELVSGLSVQPMGVVTPVVMLGESIEVKERCALTSILDQYFPLSTDPSLIAEFCEETHQLRLEKAKRGFLGVISIPQVLVQASQLRLSGAIVIEREEEKCIIYLEDGLVVFASSNRDENRFGEFLVRQGVITEEAFQHATALLQESGKRFGHILVEEGVIKPQVLQTLVQSQVKHIIYTVFDWPSGEFFILLDEKSMQTDVTAKFDVASLILEGVRFRFTEEKLVQHFHPFDQIVSLALSRDDIQKHMHLSRHELDFLRSVGENQTVHDLIHLNSFSRVEALKFLYAFKILGFLLFEAPASKATKVSTEVNQKAEREAAVTELFKKKSVFTPRKEAPLLPPEEASSVPKWKMGAYSILGAAAVTLFFVIVTFVDPRSLRTGSSGEKEFVHVTVAPTVSPTVTPVSTQSPTPIPTKVLPTPTLQKVARQETGQFQRLLNLARSQKRSGALNQAVHTYRKAAVLRPRDIDVQLAIGNILFDLGRNREAKRVFQQASQIAPTHPQPYLALGTLYLMEKDSQQAARALRHYLALEKRTPQTQHHITEAKKVLQSLEGNR